MTLKTYAVQYLVSLDSDMVSTAYWTGSDEDDCRKSFEAAHPLWAVKSVEERP